MSIVQCDKEIEELKALAKSGHLDTDGILLGLHDWRTERRLIYDEFLRAKAQDGTFSGFKPLWMPSFLFDFQAANTEWHIEKGKSAGFQDCGMGKTVQELVWAENVVRHTNKPVLILTPLAVAQQTVREAAKFGIEAHRSSDGAIHPGINVTNYERLHYFRPEDFAGVVCDESSAIKSFNGKRRADVTFSKKWENLRAALALHFAYYNFCRVHRSIKMTPAMAAGLTGTAWSLAKLIS